jgi:hypothetical protein
MAFGVKRRWRHDFYIADMTKIFFLMRAGVFRGTSCKEADEKGVRGALQALNAI